MEQIRSIFRRRAVAAPALVLAGLSLLVTGSACRGRHGRTAVKNEEPLPGLKTASTVRMGDPEASAQLPAGFYSVEGGGGWRWTAGSFRILLRPPLGSAQRGAALTFSFSIPDAVLDKLKPLTLTVSVGGVKLKSEKFSKSGASVLTADVPPGMLAQESVLFDFALDKSLPAGTVDKRELGVVATAASLESK